MIIYKYTERCVQCQVNVLAWLSYKRLTPPGGVVFLEAYPDRVFIERNQKLEDSVSLDISSFCECYAGNHGSDVITGFRENVGRCAAQVIIHTTAIEIDFDYWRPWDVVGIFSHGWEILTNKIKKRKTDPFRIREELEKRGVYGSKTDSNAG